MAITLDSSCLHTSAVTTSEFEMQSPTFRHVLEKATFASLSLRRVKFLQYFYLKRKSCIDIRSHSLNVIIEAGRGKMGNFQNCVRMYLSVHVCVCKDAIELEISRLSYTKRQLIRVCYIGDLSD